MSEELKERNLLKLIFIVRFACAMLDVGHPITGLLLFNSVQKFTCDILGNVTTISINQALESIHPVDKDRFDHFD
jgi:hypothetical protein